MKAVILINSMDDDNNVSYAILKGENLDEEIGNLALDNAQSYNWAEIAPTVNNIRVLRGLADKLEELKNEGQADARMVLYTGKILTFKSPIDGLETYENVEVVRHGMKNITVNVKNDRGKLVYYVSFSPYAGSCQLMVSDDIRVCGENYATWGRSQKDVDKLAHEVEIVRKFAGMIKEAMDL